jgi:hypothetical protein
MFPQERELVGTDAHVGGTKSHSCASSTQDTQRGGEPMTGLRFLLEAAVIAVVQFVWHRDWELQLFLADQNKNGNPCYLFWLTMASAGRPCCIIWDVLFLPPLMPIITSPNINSSSCETESASSLATSERLTPSS